MDQRSLAHILLSLPDVILATDVGGARILEVNRESGPIFGYSRAELLDLPFSALFPRLGAAALARVLDAGHASNAHSGTLETICRQKDGSEIPVDIRFGRMADPGSAVRILAMVRERARAMEREIASFVQNAREAIITWDLDGHIAAEILRGAVPKSDRQLDAARSERMRETLRAADIVAEDPLATVLLLGETGVGKSWLARRIHAKSPRADKPFFEVNCASLGPQLVESELFGHERGAFTGAAVQKRGIVETAEGGTLFLDEVGELPAGVQAQLLSFLDHRRFRRVGGTRVMAADVRIVAATNVDLRQLADRGAFRRDLYFRLSVIPIEVPPLRERREEIPALARQVLEDLALRFARHPIYLDRTFTEILQRYDWPGNVRELRNAIERALILSRGGPLDPAHLPAEIRSVAQRAKDSAIRLEDVERSHILRILDEAKGNRTHAAEMVGISRSTLKRKLAEIGMKQ